MKEKHKYRKTSIKKSLKQCRNVMTKIKSKHFKTKVTKHTKQMLQLLFYQIS